MKSETHKKIIKPLKILLILVTFGFILYKLVYTYEINELWKNFIKTRETPNYYLLLTALLLMFLNWGIEIIKWKKLISIYEYFDYKNAAKSILSGIALSIITPNQLGDFAGRVIHLKKFNKIKGSLVAVVGHTAQLMVTIYSGIFGFIFFAWHYNWFNPSIKITSIFFLILLFMFMFYLFLHFTKITSKIFGLRIFERIKDYLAVFSNYSQKLLFQIMLLSVVRYGVFLLQYYFLLEFFGVNLPVFTSLASICVIFLAQSVVPSFIFLDIGLRGASAIWILEKFSNNTIGILLSAYTLWMINMMLPAILGLFIIYNTKISELE